MLTDEIVRVDDGLLCGAYFARNSCQKGFQIPESPKEAAFGMAFRSEYGVPGQEIAPLKLALTSQSLLVRILPFNRHQSRTTLLPSYGGPLRWATGFGH